MENIVTIQQRHSGKDECLVCWRNIDKQETSADAFLAALRTDK